jgi:hypothetical protein
MAQNVLSTVQFASLQQRVPDLDKISVIKVSLLLTSYFFTYDSTKFLDYNAEAYLQK